MCVCIKHNNRMSFDHRHGLNAFNAKYTDKKNFNTNKIFAC